MSDIMHNIIIKFNPSEGGEIDDVVLQMSDMEELYDSVNYYTSGFNIKDIIICEDNGEIYNDIINHCRDLEKDELAKKIILNGVAMRHSEAAFLLAIYYRDYEKNAEEIKKNILLYFELSSDIDERYNYISMILKVYHELSVESKLDVFRIVKATFPNYTKENLIENNMENMIINYLRMSEFDYNLWIDFAKEIRIVE
jgi:hypothetical protein